MQQHTQLLLTTLLLSLYGCGGGDTTTENNDTALTTPPVTTPAPTLDAPTVSEQPDPQTQLPYARIAFASEGASGYECQLDDGLFEPCASPHDIYPLAVGEHTLSVRAVDDNGDASEASQINWTVNSLFDADAGIHPDLVATNVQPDPVAANSWRGILRINCDFAHASYDDPIVFPGQDGAAHLHRFYGNTLTDENSTTTSLFTDGESSCQGNTLNRSAYWVPTLLAPAYNPDTGQRLVDDDGQDAWKVVPAVVGNDDEAHEIFYYSAGVDDLDSIQPIPLGLKMIAGDHMGQPGNEQDTSIVRWHCQSWESDESSNPQWSTSIPACVAPDRLRMDIFFPSCWNGIDLDSADHKSHLAYPVNYGGQLGTACPETHPVPIIRVSFHYAFGVKPDVYEPETQSSQGWQLASDMYDASSETPGGMSLHGDWFNAWHPEALQAVLDTCIKQELDCHDGNLANGYRLTGTRPGTQEEPAIINRGKGL
ncbi:DUF1996 domain-containing protein [Aestuariibacter halophilus]|uniref:DUF1996 domain-containing protein n=1 Tax=Fluctibacter halophilus TaxID=226011 RepID=A0ABS8G7T7_9ALTE|nr:DUF1996 domain-containing protein [Aestuariibacter halophilus]MCC2616534.1 DUF1996 domain-containing protein [Aestuariibacter halophilus]